MSQEKTVEQRWVVGVGHDAGMSGRSQMRRSTNEATVGHAAGQGFGGLCSLPRCRPSLPSGRLAACCVYYLDSVGIHVHVIHKWTRLTTSPAL